MNNLEYTINRFIFQFDPVTSNTGKRTPYTKKLTMPELVFNNLRRLTTVAFLGFNLETNEDLKQGNYPKEKQTDYFIKAFGTDLSPYLTRLHRFIFSLMNNGLSLRILDLNNIEVTINGSLTIEIITV